MDVVDDILEQIDYVTQWRREKAEEFPASHPERDQNLHAAAELDRLTEDILAVPESEMDPLLRSFHNTLQSFDDALCGQLNDLMDEWLWSELCAIGFCTWYRSGIEFLNAYAAEARRLLRNVESGLPPLGETVTIPERVENNPDVQALKQALEKGRAKASAEAWGQLFERSPLAKKR